MSDEFLDDMYSDIFHFCVSCGTGDPVNDDRLCFDCDRDKNDSGDGGWYE